nr:uncharacterized protein LOC117691964 [Crassostrea gigas]
MGMLLKQTKIEAEEGNCEARQTLKKIGSAYLKHREVSAQEAVYRVCNLKMKECSRKVVFVPVGENPTRLSKPLFQIKQKTHKEKEEANEEGNEEDEENIWMTNIVERYENRPNKTMFHDMCLAEFCSEYRVLAKSQVPKTPNENVFELLNSKGFIQKRTRTKPAVIRYPRFNVDKMSEKYYQCLLQLFLPHERGSQLKPPGFDLYQTFYENGHVKIANDQNLQAVKLLVDRNHAKFAENEEIIANAQETFETIGEPQDAWASLCPETELIRKECMEERSKLNVLNDNVDEIPDMETEANSADVMFKVQQNNQSREEAMQIIQNLNETQRNIFYYVRDWCLEKSTGQNPDPFHIFITGGAGTGKSHVIKAIHYEASRLLAKNMSTPDSLAVLLTAFTGTAAFNIGGNTIHHLFSLPKYMCLPYEPLKEQTLSELRIQLRDLNVLVIDEVSMVYKRLLYYIHERLVQIKKSKEPFGGVSVIAVGDFYQLPPVKQRKDERLYKDNISYPVDHWQELFKVVELSEIMRQKQDVPFAEVLNSLRTRELQEPLNTETLSMLRECVRQGPEDVLHVYATNDEVNNYNLKMLRKSCNDFVEIDAQDFEKNTATGKLTLRKKPISRSKSDGLSSSLLIAPNARVMLTRNCNVEDGLVNGVMGKILHFLLKDGNVDHVLAVGVIFDNKNVGQRTGRKTPEGNVVLIERVQEEVVEKKSKSFIRHQFPLRLSWACTAHKVQGMTVDKVVVNLDRIFSAGQGYVALTRVKSKDGLFIETNDVNTLDKKVYADAEVKSALFGMNKLKFPNSFERSSLCTRIILHNIQSLKAHFSDLQHDLRFTEADLISLTETWLRPNENLFNFSLDGFSFHSQARGNAYDDQSIDFHTKRFAKGGGVAVYIKGNENDKTVNFLPVNNIEGIAVNLQSIHTVILTLYRPGTTIACKFLQRLQKLLEHYRKDNWNIVCIGDFNEDAHLIGPIQSFMKNQGFRQLVSFNTTEGATILDHVYVSGSLQVGVNKMSTYFSYHDAVVVTIYPNDENA